MAKHKALLYMLLLINAVLLAILPDNAEAKRKPPPPRFVWPNRPPPSPRSPPPPPPPPPSGAFGPLRQEIVDYAARDIPLLPDVVTNPADDVMQNQYQFWKQWPESILGGLSTSETYRHTLGFAVVVFRNPSHLTGPDQQLNALNNVAALTPRKCNDTSLPDECLIEGGAVTQQITYGKEPRWMDGALNPMGRRPHPSATAMVFFWSELVEQKNPLALHQAKAIADSVPPILKACALPKEPRNQRPLRLAKCIQERLPDHRGILVSIHTPEWKQYQPKAGAMTTLARNEGHVYSTKFLDVAASGTPGLGEEKWWQISIMFAKLEPVAAGAGGSGSFGAK